ncbi:MAG: HDOD domain-containing protein [Armatimonadetes bacterium]|nr:HDOD domain-containing protein [Armatimonadota bacterium]
MNVLFVDDEQAILDGYRFLMHQFRRQWTSFYACSANDAIDILSREAIDLVISDMRMPGIDGAELLAIVRERWPGVTRIVLTGQADQAAMMRAIPEAHQFLSKPCDHVTLTEFIQRVAILRAQTMSDDLLQIAGALPTLPSAPKVYNAIMSALRNENASIVQIARIVESDPTLSARVLQLINSSYYGSGKRVSSIAVATQLLGLDFIRTLTLACHVFQSSTSTEHKLWLDSFQEHSLTVARTMMELARQDDKEVWFAAGLLHDIGENVLRTRISSNDHAAEDILRNHKGLHARIGAYLLGSWGISMPIVEATALHHTPWLAVGEARRISSLLFAIEVSVNEESLVDVPPEFLPEVEECLTNIPASFLAEGVA